MQRSHTEQTVGIAGSTALQQTGMALESIRSEDLEHAALLPFDISAQTESSALRAAGY